MAHAVKVAISCEGCGYFLLWVRGCHSISSGVVNAQACKQMHAGHPAGAAIGALASKTNPLLNAKKKIIVTKNNDYSSDPPPAPTVVTVPVPTPAAPADSPPSVVRFILLVEAWLSVCVVSPWQLL